MLTRPCDSTTGPTLAFTRSIPKKSCVMDLHYPHGYFEMLHLLTWLIYVHRVQYGSEIILLKFPPKKILFHIIILKFSINVIFDTCFKKIVYIAHIVSLKTVCDHYDL